jgi:Ca-activated chloride channel family protein
MRSFITPALAVSALLAAVVAPRLVRAPSSPAAPVPVEVPAPALVPASLAPTTRTGPQLTVTLDRTMALRDGQVRAELTLLAPLAEEEDAALPTDVVLVIDRSGSMGGDKMAEAKRAAHALVGQLGPSDRVAVVSFAGSASVDMPLAPVGQPTTRAIDSLAPGGGTSIQDGLHVALGQLAVPAPGRARRVILVSDGRPGSEVGLDEAAVRAAAGEAPLTTVGIGDDYDPLLLQRLADRGTGNHYHAGPSTPLDAVFAAEFEASRTVVARSTRLTHTAAGPARVIDWGGLPADAGGVALGPLFSGQRRTVWVTLQLDDPTGTDLDLGRFDLTWTSLEEERLAKQTPVGRIGLTDAPEQVADHLDAPNWARNVVTNEYNAVLQGVTAALDSGDRTAAMQQLQAYRTKNEAMNAVVQSQAVTDNLAAVQRLEREVAADRIRRKGLVELSTRAYQRRRGGSSRGSFGDYGSR